MHFIEFPKLGIHIDLNPELFSVGPFSIHWYGIITALAFIIVVGGAVKNSAKFGINQDDLIDMVLITVPVGIIGARLFYVLLNWDFYSADLSEIYKIWHGGLAIYGGIICGIITIYLFCRRRKIDVLQLLDHIVVYLVLGQAAGRWGNFVNQELFGPNTDLPWGMTGDIIQRSIAIGEYPGVDYQLPVHPLFLYESLWNLAAFFILLWIRKRKKLQGEVFSMYMILYGGARFVIDRLRFDLKVGDININRMIGLVFVIAFTGVFIYRRIRLKREPIAETPETETPSRYREILNNLEEEDSDELSFIKPETKIMDSVNEKLPELNKADESEVSGDEKSQDNVETGMAEEDTIERI